MKISKFNRTLEIIERELAMARSVICLDGDLPFKILRCIPAGKIIIAADGSADKLLGNGITPSIIIGDLDSVSPRALGICKHLKYDDQDFTDFEKVISYAEEQGLLPAVIIGINGGYPDRILANVQIFSRTDSVFLSDDMMGMAISGSREIQLPISTKVSIFGMNEAVVTSRGLKWELTNTRLTFGQTWSCSNRTASSKISLNVSGRALIFIYLNDITDFGKT